MTQQLYWHAPVWEVALAAVLGLIVLTLLAWRAFRRPDVGRALTAFDPALDRLPLFHFDGAHGVRAVSSAGARVLADARVTEDGRDDHTLVEACLSCFESARATRRDGWPTSDETLIAAPISAAGSTVSGVIAVVVSTALEPPDADPDTAWLDADPRVWRTVGEMLKVHRERPTVRVRRPKAAGEHGHRWYEAQLTQTEALLLRAMLARAGEPTPADRLFAAVWADEDVDRLGLRPDQSDRLRRLVFQLRQRVEPEPSEPRYVCTVRGVGYALYEDEASVR